MKRRLIIIVSVAIALCLALAISEAVGAGAWFNDQETSIGNSLTSGTLERKVGGQE